MGQVLHGSATTTEAVRRAIQHSQESLRVLARRYGINRRPSPSGSVGIRSPTSRPAPRTPDQRCCRSPKRQSSSPSASNAAAARRLPLCPAAHHPASDPLVIASLPAAARNLELPQIEGEASAKRKFKAYPIGYFHIDIAEVRTAEGKLYLLVAIDRTSKFAFVELHEKVSRSTPQTSCVGSLTPCPTRSTRSLPITEPTSPLPGNSCSPVRNQGDDRRAEPV